MKKPRKTQPKDFEIVRNPNILNRAVQVVYFGEMRFEYGRGYYRPETIIEIQHDENDKRDPLSYRLQARRDDRLANWQSRERAAALVGEEALAEGERQVWEIVNKDIPAMLRKAHASPAYKAIAMEAKRFGWPKHYAKDLEYYDAMTIAQQGGDAPLVWILRDSGTHIFYAWDNHSQVYLKDGDREDWKLYIWDGSGLSNATNAEATTYLQEVQAWKDGKRDKPITKFTQMMQVQHSLF